MKSIQIFLEKFNCIPFEGKPKILLQAWYKFFAIQHDKPEDSNELFQKLLEDLKELAEYGNSPSKDHPIFNNDEEHYDQNKEHLENSSNEIAASNSNQEKEKPPQDSNIRKLIREECCVEVYEEKKQKMEDTILELVEIFHQKELLCMHDNVDDLIESALNSILLLINSQRLNKEKQEVKNVLQHPDERRTRIIESLQNYEIIKSGVEELVPILSENEVTLEDKREGDVPVCENSPICDNHSEIFPDSKNNDDISSDDDDFEDIEYVDASLSDPEIFSVAEENVVYQEEKEEKLIKVVKNNIPDDSTNDPLLEEADLFLASDNSIPSGIKNFSDDSEKDIRFLEALLSDDSIPFPNNELSESDFDNPSVPQPPQEQPDADFEPDSGDEISIVMKNNDKLECLNPIDEFDDDYFSFIFVIYSKMFLSFLSVESEDTIFDPGITIYRFYLFKLGLSHRCGTFKKFSTHRSHLNESPMEMRVVPRNYDPKGARFLIASHFPTPPLAYDYPDVHPPSQEISEEVFQAKGDLMKSIQIFLEKFNCIPFEEKPKILLQAWYKFFAIQHAKPEDSNQLFQKLLEDLKELAEYGNSPSKDHPIFNNDEEHSDQNKEHLENSSNEIAASNSNQEKEKPPQNSNIHKLIREECCVEVCEEKKQKLEDTILELVEICRQKELLCMHDNVDDLIESALNSILLSINSQRLNNEKQEVKNVVQQPAERRTRIIESLQNCKVIHKSSISLNNTSQTSPVHAIAPILSTKEPEYSTSMGDKHPNTTLEMKLDEIIKSGVEELVPILSKNEVTLEDKREGDVPVCENSPICDNHSEIFPDSKNNDDILSDDDDFEDIEYVDASLSDPEIVSVAEENVVYQEEEEVNFEDISQIQDVILCEKLLSMNRLIANIKSLNDNPTPDLVLNSFVSFPISEEFHNSLSDNFSPEFETFCHHTKETRSGNTTTHTNDSLPECDSFCFEIKPDQEKLINVVKNNIPDDSTNDPFLKEADLFLAFDNSIPSGIENFGDDSERDIRFLEALISDDSIPFPNNELSESDFHNPSVPQPPPEQPDADFEPDSEDEILVVIKNKDKIECLNPRDEFDDDYFSFMFVIYSNMFLSFLSAESEDTIFDPGIAIYRFYLFKLGLSHRCGTFKKFSTHRSHLNESPIEMLFSICFSSNQ
nr:hypothetical protein [Tanacetum cinerariifolium]